MMAILNRVKNNKDYTLDMRVVSNIKSLGIDMINSAGSGHPGIVLGACPILYRLYNKHLVFDYNNPFWVNRDRFVMSCGHGSALLYATLFMSSFNITIADLKKFRKYGSITPGHPEAFLTPGVDCSTGPLGQGFAMGVGMAIGEAYLNKKYRYLKNSLIDHYTYVLVSDGDLMEGISYEAASIAANLGLGKLIVLYDSNGISLDGSVKHTLSENVLDRFKAMGWDTHLVNDPYNFDSFDNAIYKAKSASGKPSIIEIKTIIGKGSKYQNTNLVHGKPLDREDITRVKKKIDIRDVEYTVLSDAFDYMKECIDERNDILIKKWNKLRDKMLVKMSKELVADFDNLCSCNSVIDIKKSKIKFDKNKEYSGRDISHVILNKISDKDIMCLCTDTRSSTKVYFDDVHDFGIRNREGKNVVCGVREFASSAIMNGLLLSGVRCITSTFLSFSNYMIPSIRMASLMRLGGIYVFTHDSVLVGEDGPTHQPIEQIEMLRSIPGVVVFRPCDKNEVIGAYKYAFSNNVPTVIVLSKDVLPDCTGSDVKMVNRGGYVLKSSEDDRVCLVASGSEVSTALAVADLLEKHMISARVVSMPSIELFDKLKKQEKEKILPKGMKKVVLELSSCQSYYKYLDSSDVVLNVNKYLKSGNKEEVVRKISYDVNSLLEKIIKLVK